MTVPPKENSMKQTIALVDDDRNILTSIQMTLEQEGFQVRTYTDGESALAWSCCNGCASAVPCR